MTKDDILKMIFFDEGSNDSKKYIKYSDRYYFTPNNTPLKKSKDLFVINIKLNTIYGYLLGSFQTKLRDLRAYMTPEETAVVMKDIQLCKEVIKNLLNTCRQVIIEKSEDDLPEDTINEIYKVSNQELDEIYRIVPVYIKEEFSNIIRS